MNTWWSEERPLALCGSLAMSWYVVENLCLDSHRDNLYSESHTIAERKKTHRLDDLVRLETNIPKQYSSQMMQMSPNIKPPCVQVILSPSDIVPTSAPALFIFDDLLPIGKEILEASGFVAIVIPIQNLP